MKTADIVLKKIRSGNTGGGAAFAFAIVLSFTIFAGTMLSGSLYQGADNLKKRLGADIAVVPKGQESAYEAVLLNGEPVECSFERKYESIIRGTEGVEKVTPVIYLASLNASCCSVPIQIIGYDPETDFVTSPWISDKYTSGNSDGDLIVGCNIAINEENTLTFFGRTYNVGARLNKTGTGMDKSVYVSFDVMEQLIKDAKEKGVQFGDGEGYDETVTDRYVSAFMVDIADDHNLDAVAGSLLMEVPGAVVKSKKVFQSVTDGIGLITSVIRAIIYLAFAGITFVTVILHIYRVGNRKKEWAVYRMIGGSKGWILKLIFTETVTLSFLGAVVGVLLAALFYFPFCDYISQQIKFPFIIPQVSQIVNTALIAIGATILSGAVPGLIAGEIASGTECYELMREGEN